MNAATPDLVTHPGGCHCGAVRFEVDALTEYTVNTGVAHHWEDSAGALRHLSSG